METEGRVRRSRGSCDVQTRQSQPRVGTPMEVPLPRIVKTACIVVRSFDQSAGSLFFSCWRLYCLGSDCVRQLEKHHAEVEQRVLQQAGLSLGKIALRFVGQNAKDVHILACSNDIDTRL